MDQNYPNDVEQTAVTPLVVFDLDDTLANAEHRAHILEQEFETEGEKWDTFFDACDRDAPVFPIIAIYNSLVASGHYRVEIWTGRSEKVRQKTEDWLSKFLFDWFPRTADFYEIQGYKPVLRMRPADDFRKDTEVKGEFLEQAGQTPFMAFDDRNVMVKWWRDQGVTCLQVKESDF